MWAAAFPVSVCLTYHRRTSPGGGDLFDLRLQESQLRYVTTSRAAETSLAENYVGLDSL